MNTETTKGEELKEQVEALKAEVQRQKAWTAALGILVLLLTTGILGFIWLVTHWGV